jgi:hypothetical protein
MARRKCRKFNPEFKAEAVRLARVGDRSVQQICWSSWSRSVATSGDSASAGNGDRCSSSSTHSVPARAAAATASTPVRTRSSSGLRKCIRCTDPVLEQRCA